MGLVVVEVDVVELDVVELDVVELDVVELDVVELDVVELDVVVAPSQGPIVSPCPTWPRRACWGTCIVFWPGVPRLWQIVTLSGAARASCPPLRIRATRENSPTRAFRRSNNSTSLGDGPHDPQHLGARPLGCYQDHTPKSRDKARAQNRNGTS